MRKTLIVVAVVLVIVVAAGVGGVLYVRSSAEARFNAALERFSSPPVAVLKKVSYQGGLFGAEAETALEINAGPQKVSIPFKHTISYAPFGSGLAEVRTEMQVPPAIKPMVDAVFKGATPLSGTTVIHFDGSEETQFESPGFTVKDPAGTANWQGIKGTLSVEGAHVLMKANAPGLKLESAMGNVTLQGLSSTADMTKSADDLWLGSNTLEMAKLNVAPPLIPAITAQTLKLTVGLAEQGSGVVRYNLGLDLGRLEAQEMAFTKIGYEMEFSNLDRAVLQKWSKSMGNYRPKGPDMGPEMAGMFVKDMGTFLKRSPKASLKRCTAVTPWGDFKLTATAAFDGKGEIPTQPTEWLTRVGVEGKLDISSSLLTWLLQQQVKKRAELIANAGKQPHPEQAQMLTEKLAQVRLTRLEQTGAVVRNGDRYLLEIKTVEGVPTVNGKNMQEISSLID